MNKTKLFGIFTLLFFAWGCGGKPAANNANNSNANAINSSNVSQAAKDTITIAERPQKIRDMMNARGQQDEAKPALKILEPAEGSVINGSTVKLKLLLGGDLRGYKPMMDEATHSGNHIHVILDNQPYEAYYNLDKEFELKNVSDGAHTIRVFPSRPWHESYKNPTAFQLVNFTVQQSAAKADQPVTTNSGTPMSDAKASSSDGKEMQPSAGGKVDPAKPLLTYSRPKGEYKGADADEIMVDFWLANGTLKGQGGQYRVRYTIDGGEPRYIDQWWPIWLKGFTEGKHAIKLELVDADGNLVENGGYNSTTREITITK